MSHKRILIVDDDQDILFLVALSVKNLGPDYEVSTAFDGAEALKQMQKQTFDLVITDYMMPGMSGMQLVQQMRQISPETQVVLMTAYDTARMRTQIENMEVDGYVGKPFTVPEILEVVKRVIAQTQAGQEAEPAGAPDISRTVAEPLRTLRAQTGAYYVVLTSSNGRPLHIEGQVSPARAARLAAFAAANFLAVTELAHLLDDNESIFNSIYHEGSKYNIYACGVSNDFLLAVVFGTASKPGTVWFYTKQTAAALATALAAMSPGSGQVNATLLADFKNLWGDDEPGVT